MGCLRVRAGGHMERAVSWGKSQIAESSLGRKSHEMGRKMLRRPCWVEKQPGTWQACDLGGPGGRPGSTCSHTGLRT